MDIQTIIRDIFNEKKEVYSTVEVAKKLGITMDQVMAFGDNLNDLHMMQVVGHPIAPENARPEILELATEVIGSHKDQSVIAYMEKLV